MVQSGELPNFADLMEKGSYGRLKTFKNANSPVIWSAIYAGKNPEEHGIFDFYRINLVGLENPGIYPLHRTFFPEIAGVLDRISISTRHIINRSFLNAVPIWEIARSAGLKTGILNGHYISYPVPKISDGSDDFFVSYGLEIFLKTYAKDEPFFESKTENFVQPSSFFNRIQPFLTGNEMSDRASILLDILKKNEQQDFINLYFYEIDTVQHHYWKWYQPQYYLFPKEKNIEKFKDVIPDLYKDFDAILGKIRNQLESNTVLIIVFDHGHTPCILHKNAFTQHRHSPSGIIMISGGPIRHNFLIKEAHIIDIFPTILYLLGLPIPEDVEGRIFGDAFGTEYLRKNPPRQISSYDFLQPEISQKKVKWTLDKKEIERLKSLGYIK